MIRDFHLGTRDLPREMVRIPRRMSALRTPGFLPRGRDESSRSRTRLVFVLATVWLVSGCSVEQYRKKADEEAYSIIRQKSSRVPGVGAGFRVEPEKPVHPTVEPGKEPLRMSLADALSIALENSREFQSTREDVFIQALALSDERHLWKGRWNGVLSGLWQKDMATDERSAEGSAGFSLSQAFATGARATLGLSSNFLKFLSNDPRTSAASAIELSIVQPLWRGAGQLAAQEQLTQAERDMIYRLRSFVEFRRALSVSIATDFYAILQQWDIVENERTNMTNLSTARERAEMLAKAGRLPDFQVGQAEQDELRARDRWLRAVQTYENLLDNFKIALSLPVDTAIALDPEEMARLKSTGLADVKHTREEFVQLALTHRLDLANASDAVEDARRKVEVAKNQLAPDVTLALGSAIGTEPPAKPLKFTADRNGRSVGLEVGLPTDRHQEQNAYRLALINADRSSRDRDELRDRIIQQVHASWRKLEEARQSCEIQRRSVALAERQVESTSLMLDAGRADMRDLLDAQSALLEARNMLTRTLVDYRIATLEMLRNTGLLAFRDGQLTEEIPNVETGKAH